MNAPSIIGYFDVLLDIIEGKGEVALLQAYFDESQRENGLLCVAGYAFRSRDTRKFIKDWERLFEPYGGFHMKEFAFGRKRFSGTTTEQRNELMRKAVGIINARMAAGAAVSCFVEETEKLSPKWIRGFGSAYSVCCHWVMNALCLALKNNPDRIVYTFEAGHQHESEAREFVSSMVSSEELKKIYRHAGDVFLPKADAIPLQAADLLAWEWAKFYDESILTPKRPIRKSLLSLFRHAPNKYTMMHATGQKLERAMQKYKQLALEQLQEQEFERQSQSGIRKIRSGRAGTDKSPA